MSVPMRNTSCLNGYAFGNIGTSALDAATFFWQLLGERTLLNSTSLAAMRTFGPEWVMPYAGVTYVT
jgi:uncharacterized membrane protein